MDASDSSFERVKKVDDGGAVVWSPPTLNPTIVFDGGGW